MKDISIHTKFITLIGTPLGQSYAAQMQNRAYETADADLRYFYTEADSSHLKEIISGIRAMPSFIGCAITKPNKVEVLKYLDELDPLCRSMGACNTVVKQSDGSLKGYNTDGEGFWRSLCEELREIPRGMNVFCIGAGGAGRAICSVLAYRVRARFYVMDRNEAAARSLAADLQNRFGCSAWVAPYGHFDFASQCTLIVNASGIGMGSTVGQSPFPKEKFLKRQLCFDACYNPARTQFLLDAELAGCRAVNGLNMSLYQGTAQIELWTGKPAPVDIMRKELERVVYGNNS